jgi:hypothetical protein
VTDEPAKPSGAKRIPAKGVLAGVALSLVAMVVGTLVFRSYGLVLFIVSPFFIGAAVGYFANYDRPITPREARGEVYKTAFISGLLLLLFPLEGLICIVMAAPIIVVVMLLGSILGVPRRSAHVTRAPTP